MSFGFQPFDLREKFEATQRNLPHWHQPGATYFVTFRLADSLPVAVLERLEELQRVNAQEGFEWVERYLDAGSGDCILSNQAHAKTVETALLHFDGVRYDLGVYAFMPNHVHVLVQPLEPATLSSVMQSWKSYTAHQINKRDCRTGILWQTESFDRIVRDDVELRKFDAYIMANPGAAGLRPATFRLGRGSATWLELSP